MRRLVAVILTVAASIAPATAQVADGAPAGTAVAQSAVLRSLDKLGGEVADIDIRVGETLALGRLQVTLGDCRYPANNPAGDAYAYVVIRDAGVDVPAFAGWMIASSPALSALDHPRYDVWVMRCNA